MSYPPLPADIKRGGNELHDRFWGMETRSPVTPYLTAWRDVAKHTVEDRKLGWPSRIMVFAMFGTEPWTPSANLIEEATEHQMRDSGQLRLGWRWHDEAQSFALEELTLQIQRGGRERPFRSVHRGEELATLDVAVAAIARPETDNAAVPFHVSGHLRERNKSGEAQKGDAVRFTAMGSAPVQPKWMMY